MNRSKIKGPFIKNKNYIGNNKKISRNVEIVPNFVGYKFKVHNGKNFVNINITEDMIGHKIGEFSTTREKFVFKKKKKK